MPLYEYQCNECDHQFQALIMREEDKAPVCPECGGGDLKKLISLVAYHVSEKDRVNSYDSMKRDDSFHKDTRNIGLAAKNRAKKMGVDLGSGFEEKLERLRTNPESVVKDSE
jgi:putative FmdB family regulatory protein